jgi:uncharacterized protein YgiM (DUF1202 family)
VRERRNVAPLLLIVLIAAVASAALAAGEAYVVRSPSAGLYEMPNSAEPSSTLVRDQIVTVLQRRGEWYRVITADGKEGWVREATVTALPSVAEEESMISEASPDEEGEAVYYDFVIGKRKGNIRREPHLKAAIIRTAGTGEVFSIVVESGDWYQVAAEGKVAGWVHHGVGEKVESKNLSLRLLDLVEGKLSWFDQLKNEDSRFRRVGWYPSFFLRNPERDIVVEKASPARSAVTVNISYARRDVEYRMLINAADRFTLPGANRIFFSDLMLAVLDLSREIERVRLHLWFAVLEANGRLSWQSKGEVELPAAATDRLPREGSVTASVWAALESNTLSPEVWRQE